MQVIIGKRIQMTEWIDTMEEKTVTKEVQRIMALGYGPIVETQEDAKTKKPFSVIVLNTKPKGVEIKMDLYKPKEEIDTAVFPKLNHYPNVAEIDIGRPVSEKGILLMPSVKGDTYIYDSGSQGTEPLVGSFFNTIEGHANPFEMYNHTKAAAEAMQEIRSRSVGGHSKQLVLKDGTKIRWINALVKERFKGELEQASIVDGIYAEPIAPKAKEELTRSSQEQDYLTPTVLSKTDAQNKLLWQKVYLWRECSCETIGTLEALQCYKLGKLTLIDENRLFVCFGGSQKIFRLNADGMPISIRAELTVLDYNDYIKIMAKM